MSEEVEIPEWQKELGRRIASARTAKGWSIDRVAEELSVSRGSVGHWETGARTIKVQDLYALCSALSVGADNLLFGREHWPFEKVKLSAIESLEKPDLDRVEGAMMFVAGQLGIDLESARNGISA